MRFLATTALVCGAISAMTVGSLVTGALVCEALGGLVGFGTFLVGAALTGFAGGKLACELASAE